MEKNNYQLIGDLKAESHLATCGPSLATDKRKPTPIPTFEGPNGPIMYMPGAGLRSKLRGAATALILEALEARKARRFNLEDAQFNRVGGIKQGVAESGLNVTAYQEMIRSNPIIGLFGASTPWVKGKASVGHVSCCNPNVRPMHVEGVRSDIIRREPGIVDYLSDDALGAYSADIDRTRAYGAKKREIEELTKSLRAATSEEKKKIQLSIKAIEKTIVDGGLKHVAAQQPLQGYLAIPPGSELENKIHILSASQIELGAFVAALERFAEAPVLGAHSAHGAGVISGTWQVSKTRVGSIGSLRIDPFVGLAIEGEELIAAKAAFEAFILSDACQPYSNADSLIASTADAESSVE